MLLHINCIFIYCTTVKVFFLNFLIEEKSESSKLFLLIDVISYNIRMVIN